MKRFFAILSAAFLFAGTTVFAFTSKSDDSQRILSSPIWMPPDILLDNENLPIARSTSMESEYEMGFVEQAGQQIKFTNRVDGYSVLLPNNMSVDMSLSDVGTKFEDAHRSLRIFKQTFRTATELRSYIEYSNKFIENKVNHTVENEETYKDGIRTVHILQWSRRALSRIKNDKCCYACVDVSIGSRVYTFSFSSDIPFYLCGGYMDIVNSLATFDPVLPAPNAYNKGYKKVPLTGRNAEAQSTYSSLFSEDSPTRFGIFSPDQFGGFAKLEEFEKDLGYKFCTFLVYTELIDKGTDSGLSYTSKVTNYILKLENYFKYANQTGKSIELTLQTPVSRLSDSNMIYEILNGDYDQFINQYASLIAKYKNVTVLFRPFNEMNCDWCNYSAYYTSRDPSLYVQLYRYLYDKFKQRGCTNTLWVWNPNECSFPKYKWNNESLYYPGDEYVDIYGITGYNTGTYYKAEKWRSFDDIYEPIYSRAEKINEKPIMITEFSCSSDGGDKKAWIDDMFKSLKKYSKIKVAVWWHAADYDGDKLARPYFIDTPDGTLDIFKKYLNQ